MQSSGHGAFDQSVISAVYKASPLPVPDGNEFDELFQDFNFRFTP
ncbi:MAG: cell envelope integrity protein TolA [Thiohalocapsa sp.]